MNFYIYEKKVTGEDYRFKGPFSSRQLADYWLDEYVELYGSTNLYVVEEKPAIDDKKLRRRIEDYLRKYATKPQLYQVADLLGIKTE